MPRLARTLRRSPSPPRCVVAPTASPGGPTGARVWRTSATRPPRHGPRSPPGSQQPRLPPPRRPPAPGWP
eukprot:4377573-Pleurochrysis_carterae.AAC.1